MYHSVLLVLEQIPHTRSGLSRSCFRGVWVIMQGWSQSFGLLTWGGDGGRGVISRGNGMSIVGSWNVVGVFFWLIWISMVFGIL